MHPVYNVIIHLTRIPKRKQKQNETKKKKKERTKIMSQPRLSHEKADHQ